MTQSTITRFFKKELQSMTPSMNTHCIKEEVDIDWDERDNCYGDALYNGQREYIARVVLEKLPESVFQRYADKKNAAPVRTAQCSEESPVSKTNIKKKKHLRIQCAHCSYKAGYKSILIKHLTSAHKNEENIYQDENKYARKYTRVCEKCNETSEGRNSRNCEKCSNKLQFKCNGCAKLFKTHSLFGYHWYTRCGVKGYFKCTKCDFKSVWRAKVVQHMEIMHKSPNLSEEFKNIEWIALNYDSTIAKSNDYRCPKCTKTMENPAKLALHIKSCGGLEFAKNDEILSKKSTEVHRVDPKSLIKCSSCGKQFDHIYTLNDHTRFCKMKMEYMTKVNDDEDVKDDITVSDYPAKSLMSADKRYARYLKMMVRYCSNCQEDTALEEKNRGLSRKVPCRKCKTTLLFKCTKCLKQSAEYKVIKYHLDTTCNPKEEFKCTKCDYKSYSPKIIKEHYFTQHGTAHLECKQCGNKFRTNGQLSNHLPRCGLNPTLQCEHCPFKSKRKFYLKIHIFHNHMKPVIKNQYVMIKMSKQRFTETAGHLTVHCSKCKDERNLRDRLKTCRKCRTELYFQCKTCKNCGVYEENACDHVKSYLEAIQFECKRCGRGYKSKNNLSSHRSRCDAKVNTFKCRFCKYVSKYKASIKVHEKIRHLNVA